MKQVRIFIFFVFIAFLFYAFRATSSDCKLDFASAPKCAPHTLIPPQHFPAQIIFLPTRMSSDEILEVVKAVEGTGTKIALENRSEVAAQLQKLKPTDYPIIQELLESTTIDLSEKGQISPLGGDAYKRDFRILGFDPNTRTVLNTSLLGAVTEKDKPVTNVFCGLKMKTQYADPGDKAANLGGNIISLPGGACITSKMSPDLVRKVCGSATPVLNLETFTVLGHVDEIFNIVPNHNRSPPCDFSILMASPAAQLEILKKDLSGLFFGKEGLNLIKDGQAIRRNAEPENKVDDFCEILKSFDFLMNLENEMSHPVESEARRGVASVITIQRLNAVNESDRKQFPKESKFIEKFKSRSCEDYTNGDVVKILEAEKYFSEVRKFLKTQYEKAEKQPGVSVYSKISAAFEGVEHFAATNQDINKIQERNLLKIKASLPSECREKDVVVHLPDLFHKLNSLNPNPTNSLVAGKGILVPMQFNRATASAIETELKKTSLIPIVLNTFWAHLGRGNVHCLSNEVRLCNP